MKAMDIYHELMKDDKGEHAKVRSHSVRNLSELRHSSSSVHIPVKLAAFLTPWFEVYIDWAGKADYAVLP